MIKFVVFPPTPTSFGEMMPFKIPYVNLDLEWKTEGLPLRILGLWRKDKKKKPLFSLPSGGYVLHLLFFHFFLAASPPPTGDQVIIT